jgi:hypothetical protein
MCRMHLASVRRTALVPLRGSPVARNSPDGSNSKADRMSSSTDRAAQQSGRKRCIVILYRPAVQGHPVPASWVRQCRSDYPVLTKLEQAAIQPGSAGTQERRRLYLHRLTLSVNVRGFWVRTFRISSFSVGCPKHCKNCHSSLFHGTPPIRYLNPQATRSARPYN